MPTVIVLFFTIGLDAEIRGKLVKDFGFRKLKSGLSHFKFAFVDGLEDDWINVVANSYQSACTLIMSVDESLKYLLERRLYVGVEFYWCS